MGDLRVSDGGAHNRALYSNRFSEGDQRARTRLWKVLIDEFFVRYIPSSSVVLDLGSGDCAFINALTASRRIAVDIDPGLRESAAEGVEVHVGELVEGDFRDQIDVIMASNVFEHLTSPEQLMDTLITCRAALRTAGRLVILQPNFKYSYREFYDYVDHRLPLTHHGLIEALEAVGFEIERVVPRFLPFSAKRQRLRQTWVLRTYLALKPLWWVFGKQMLVIARSP